MNPTTQDFKLAGIFLDHSLKIKAKEKVLISVSEHISNPLIKAVYIETLKRGAYPVIDSGISNLYVNRASFDGLNYQLYKLANDWQLNYIPEDILKAYVDWADAFVRITSIFNKTELSQIATDKVGKRKKLVSPIFESMINSDRWVLTYYPTYAMAQAAGVSLEWLTDFYYKACIVDYAKMEAELQGLEKVLDTGKEVKVMGEDTDLKLSIAGNLAKAAYGEANIPDGEVFLAPIPESVEGKVYFDMPTLYHGSEMHGIRLVFKKGKVVKATAEVGQAALEEILNTDKGSRYLGEFAIGANYNIKDAMKETLFDEKIGGTIHMALGRAYKEKRGGAPEGGNKSVIHWDIVKDMRKKGSVVLVDGKEVLKDGRILF
ncbi:MAG: aminopeptidase [Candidatus Dojkabacteria bacterium]